MTNYRHLAMKYLKAGRHQSILTILGVALTVMVLYTGLNLAVSYVLQEQKSERTQADYEFVFLTDDNEKITQILADDRIKQAYVGAYAGEDPETGEETVYDHALYVTTMKPYRMDRIRQSMADTYGVETELNGNLAVWYFQDMDGSGVLVMALLVLLIADIFAIFAVGVIRNTIQMFTLEQKKDYGILRCIGATKGQLSGLIYKMGAALELTGIVIGVISGTMASVLVGWLTDMDAGFHVAPLGLILVLYLGDLFFVMNENSKFITRMSPVSAVRGEYRIKKEKWKHHGDGLMGKLFGIKGAYARKSVLRNRGRFVKTVTGMTFCVAAIAFVLNGYKMISGTVDNYFARCGTYQLQIVNNPSAKMDIDEAESGLPSAESMKALSAKRCVVRSKKVYQCEGTLADWREYTGKITEAYGTQANAGQLIEKYIANAKQDVQTNESAEFQKAFAEEFCSAVTVTGQDAEDLEGMKAYLKDGTTDLSENGILVMTGGRSWYQDYDDASASYDVTKHFDTYDVKVGDEITLVDYAMYGERVQEAMEEIEAEEQEKEANEEVQEEDDTVSDEEVVTSSDEEMSTNRKGYVARKQIKEELIAEGYCKTYVVEGILDLGEQTVEYEQIYMPLATYFAYTGYTENQISGMKYELDTDMVTDSFYKNIDFGETGISVDADNAFSAIQIRSYVRYAFVIVVFIFSLCAVNSINTTIGSLHLRRKEFAQLRVIGMSKRELSKTVLLEGVMTTTLSCILGFAVGTGLLFWLYHYIVLLLYVKREIMWSAFLLAFVLTACVICGSGYATVRGLPDAMADDLKIEE